MSAEGGKRGFRPRSLASRTTEHGVHSRRVYPASGYSDDSRCNKLAITDAHSLEVVLAAGGGRREEHRAKFSRSPALLLVGSSNLCTDLSGLYPIT